MLIKPHENLARVDLLERPHLGVVLDNKDPKKLGRLKCSIQGLIEGSTSDLPWTFPLSPFGLGGKANVSSFSVPEVGTFLTIVFPYHDIYHPAYSGYWQNALTHQASLDEDYPDSYGWLDSTGTFFKVNKKQGTLKIKHGPSGSILELDKEGNLKIEHPKDLTAKTGGDMMWDVGGDLEFFVAGNCKVTAEGNIDLTSAATLTATANVIYLN